MDMIVIARRSKKIYNKHTCCIKVKIQGELE